MEEGSWGEKYSWKPTLYLNYSWTVFWCCWGCLSRFPDWTDEFIKGVPLYLVSTIKICCCAGLANHSPRTCQAQPTSVIETLWSGNHLWNVDQQLMFDSWMLFVGDWPLDDLHSHSLPCPMHCTGWMEWKKFQHAFRAIINRIRGQSGWWNAAPRN